MKTMRGWVVGVGLALLLMGCETDPDAWKEARSDKGRVLSPQVGDEALSAQVQASNLFGFDLYENLYQEPGNLLFSPYLVRRALGAVYGGSSGDTAAQMRNVLHLGTDVVQLYSALSLLELELAEGTEAAAGLRQHMALWLQKGQVVTEPFLDFLALYYGAGVRFADFAGDPRSVKDEIDGWLEANSEAVPDAWTRLLSASVFQLPGAFGEPYALPSAGPFQGIDGAEWAVPSVCKRFSARLARGEFYQAIEVPLSGEGLSMLVIAPDPGRLRDLDRALSLETLAGITETLQPRELILEMPRFTLEGAGSLNLPLLELGMKDAFSSSLANFSGISGDKGLFLARVQHVSTFSLVPGTKGSGTKGSPRLACANPDGQGDAEVLRIDRPFVFLVREQTRGTVLLIGRIVKP